MRRAARLVRPRKVSTPDEWGARHRVYPETAGVPGPRDSTLTSNAIHFARAIAAADGQFSRVVLTCGSQMGKTDAILDLIGQNFDERLMQMLYVGPTRDFVKDQFEPRVEGLFEEAPSLGERVAKGQANKKFRKLIAGVPLRFSYAGSSAGLKSDPYARVLLDEVDELLANVKGQGSPVELAEQRGHTYADFVLGAVSTPSLESVEPRDRSVF